MHGCSLVSALLVNAEVDSMGGVIDAGVGIGTKTSPRQAAIEKAQSELSQEYDVREERRRELEFLEKGGNPLDFKFGNAASVSVQSTSLIDEPREQFVTSEGKGSFALTASPHGDSVESSGRPGATTVCEPNSADNLLLFDGESEFLEDERNSARPNRSTVAPSKLSSQLNESQNVRKSGESGAFGLSKNRAYKRRNRSRPNRDVARSSKLDIIPSRGGQVSSFSSRHCPKDGKGLVLDTNDQNDLNISSNCDVKPISPNGSVGPKTLPSNSPLDTELDGVQGIESTTGLTKVILPDPVSGFSTSKSLQDDDQNQQLQVDAQQTSVMASEMPESVGGRKLLGSTDLECPPCLSAFAAKAENQTSSQLNGFSNGKGDRSSIPNEHQSSSASLRMKGFELESSCTQNSINLDGNNDFDLSNNLTNADSNGNTKEQALVMEEEANMEGGEMLQVKSVKKTDEDDAFIDDEHNSVRQSPQGNGSILGTKEELHGSGSGLENEVKCSTSVVVMELGGECASVTEKVTGNSVTDVLNAPKENDFTGRLPGPLDSGIHDSSVPLRENAPGTQSSMDPSIVSLSETTLSVRGSRSTDAPEQQKSSEIFPKVAKKAQEDSILEEARIIEAKRKRIAELSVGTLPLETRRKSQWDFVLEEMTWLANDFAQERIWKITAAAQLGHHIASTSQSRVEEQGLRLKQKNVAHTLAKAIREFWRSAEETSKELKQQCPSRDSSRPVLGYAVRYLQYNTSLLSVDLAEAPATPDRISDFGMEMSWEDHFTEANLFYTLPSCSMETYRKSIETHLAQFEKMSSSIQEEVDTSMYDAADFGSQDNAYEEDEGETSTYYLPSAFADSKPPKFGHKKKKNLTKSFSARANDLGMDFAFMQRMENKIGTQQSMLMGKRPANSLNVGLVPTKRMRTASRPRVLSPFSVDTSGGVQGPSKADASSGDTNSFQDDQSTLHGGSRFPHSLEVDSAGDFENQLLFDSTEVSKPKKKKKAKHLGSTYEQRWLHNNFQNDQMDHSNKRLNIHQLESNGNSGLFGQHIIKKRKMMRQSLDNCFDNLTPMTGSIPSPVASQMSNMSHPNKLIKILGVRHRGRKSKSFKMPAGQPGTGSQWSAFEDQALVVLVHDLGANWELVSDAINSALQFKCIFRKPKECKERHMCLMETGGDGADSAEDSGSSQPYPATLPGIPKGSARQLFQCLQGPMEEDMIKSHFEQIIILSQKQHYRRTHNGNQDQKPIQPHNSHALALSQVCPNNLNGGPPLTPFDLCDTTASSPDVPSGGYQGSHAGGLAISNQGSISPGLSTSGSNSSLQGSSNMALGNNNFSSPSGSLNMPVRDSRHGLPRSASFGVDEQQRLQQYNQVLSGRNLQQSGLPVSGAPPGTDRGVRMLPNGNGVGNAGGVNRTMPMARPGFQGITPPSMLNPGSMLSSNMSVMPNPVSAYPGVASGQGNSLLRPRDALNTMRPGQIPEHQRQMMVPELQMQVTHGNSQGVPPFGGLNPAFSNQTSSPPVHAHPLHQQQQHQMSPQQSHALTNPRHIQGPNNASTAQQQAYAIRIAKERQVQQRLRQQQQQFAASNPPVPHGQPQHQLPVSSSLPSSSQIQPQNSSVPHQQKLHMPPPHGLSRIPHTGGGGSANQMGKQQRQRQQSFQQSGNRQHPQQRPQAQSQQQAKLTKGGGRGNMLMHQNLTIDPSLLNGLSAPHGSQSEPCLYPGPGLNHVQQPPKPLIPTHSPNLSHSQQKMYSGQPNSSSNKVQQIASHSENSNHGHAAQATSAHSLQPQHKLVNQTPPIIQRVFQQNHQLNSSPLSKSQFEQTQNGQQPAGNSSQMGTTATMPQPSIDKANVMPVVSSSSAKWNRPEQMCDSGAPNLETQLVPTGGPPLASCSGSEPMPAVGLGVGQGQPSTPSLPPQKQLAQEQQQEQHLQAGNKSLYIGPTNSRPD